MFSKLIFVLATVCVVNASVLTVQIFDDDPETEVASNPKDCNLRACDQLCRRLKFPGGTCVNGRCKCDNFLNAEVLDGESEKSFSKLENSVLQEDDLDAEVAANWSKCNLKICDLVCRWIYKKNGTCVDGRCKCNNSTNTKDDYPEKSLYNLEDTVLLQDDPETEIENKKSNCNNQACDQLCRRLKFPGGACVNGRCKCDNFLNAEEGVSEKSFSKLENSVLQEDDLEAEVAANWSKCNLKICDLVCRWIYKKNGTCVDGRCKCNNSTKTKDESPEKSSYNLEDTVLLQDDPETEIENKKSNCNNQACDQLCRRLKFPGGACVNGRCKCDNFLNAEEGVSEKSFSKLENSVLQEEAEVGANRRKCNVKICDLLCHWLYSKNGTCVDGRCKCNNSTNTKDKFPKKSPYNLEDTVLLQDDPETEIENQKSNCNNQACDQLCRRLKFPGGACVNGRCKCDNFLNAEGSCDFRACDQQCFRYGYSGGTCVDGRCKCNRFLNTEDTMVDPAEFLPLSSCNSIACDDQCRRSGWHSGVCINGQCKCDYFLNTEDVMNDLEESFLLNDNFLSTEDEVSDESLPFFELSEDQTIRGCNMQACDQLCRRLKFHGGACVNGRCKCDNFLGTEDAVDEYSEFAPRRVCKVTKCNRKCTRRGYEGATCVNGRCKCYNNLQEKDEISETSLPVSELSEYQTERGCNMQACDQLCRRLKFPGGACVNGRCKCDLFFGTKDAVDEYSELVTRRVCKLRQCNRTCTRRGYETAKCINGWCNCSNKIQKQDVSPLNDVTSDENEKSYIVLRTTEEDLVVPSPSACNTVNCNQMCHRLNYAGGWCRSGQCRCY